MLDICFSRQESFQTWHGDYRDLVTWDQVAGLLGSQVGWLPFGVKPNKTWGSLTWSNYSDREL